ncbi:hypothetical protein QBC43DRAFT_319840 [Cladorrhinum sp. PSN259]|nr:hypothetical protein QBC43DRAFT_319840 [Cladorrhinum sp. PSN259]
MRLIDTTTLRLEGPFLSSPPRYCVLSHTWGASDSEVSFNDISSGDSQVHQKAGWTKILQACRHARELGISYLWVDTCCIDKSNHAEITEAINSMFEWFKGSTVCLVYLDDISAENSHYSIAAARWFTRGWTLQELIAPPDIRFYTKTWEFIGTRYTHFKEIFEVTGVDPFVLAGGDVKRVCAARRMFWASRRSTTREEDLAYCLLGIFDVSMPMRYGEGKERAFWRLQEAIIKSYGRSVHESTPIDLSLFSWKENFDWEGSGREQIFDRYGAVLKFKEVDKLSGLLAGSPRDFHRCGALFPPLGIQGEPTAGTKEADEADAADETDESLWDNMSTTSTLAQSTEDDPANTALAYSIAFLKDEPELLPLFEAVLQRPSFGRQQFQRMLLSILRSFAIDLGSEAANEAEISVATFLRKYRLILASAVTSSVVERTKKPTSLQQTDLDLLEPQLSADQALDTQEIEERQSAEEDLETEDSRCDLKEEPEVDIQFSLFEDFVRSSKAYQQMLARLHDFAYPSFSSEARHFVERLVKKEAKEETQQLEYWDTMRSRMLVVVSEMQYSRPREVFIDTRASFSLIEALQHKIEARTGERWHWWPLRSPRPLNLHVPGECLLGWICACKETRWEAVPIAFAERISLLIQKYPLDSRSATLTTPPPAKIARLPSRSFENPPYYDSRSSELPGQSLADLNSVPSGSKALELHRSTPQPRFIFLVAQAKRLVLDEIPSLYLNTEHFAEELRQAYFRHKGPLGSWLSMYGFSHCDFGKFERYCQGGYAHRGYGLPDIQRDGYYYVPTPWDPPITPEEFKDLFQHASKRQTLKWTNMFRHHEPFQLNDDSFQIPSDTVDKIPQRRWNFNERLNTREEFWGIYIREMRSALMTFTYILLCMSPLIAFCVVYLLGFVQADVQNATAPLALSLTCLGLLFSSLIRK